MFGRASRPKIVKISGSAGGVLLGDGYAKSETVGRAHLKLTLSGLPHDFMEIQGLLGFEESSDCS